MSSQADEGVVIERESSRGADLFPLALSPFEQYMLTDDRPQYPMAFTLQMHLTGSIDQAKFDEALPMALARHPLLSAKIDRSRRPWCWVPGDHSIANPIWLGRNDSLAFPGGTEFIDLEREPGIRNWIQVHGDQIVLSTQFHHALCDGIGALQFWGDWLAAYESLVTGQSPRWETLDPQGLKLRGEPRWKVTNEKVSFWQAWSSRIKETVRWVTRRPASICSKSQSDSGEIPFPSTHEYTFSAEETAGLRQAARGESVTLNDLLLNDLFQEMPRYCRQPNRGFRDRDWLQINVPTSMRDSRDQASPASNVLGYAFLARQVSSCKLGNDALLPSIAKETAAIRKWNLGMFFLDGIATARKYPGLIKLFTGSSRCFATIVFSNLGDVTRRFNARFSRESGKVTLPGLKLDRVTGVPPLRPKTHITMTAMFCSGELTLTIRANPDAFGKEDCREFLDGLVGKLLDRLDG